jgi:hypothetical protein
MRLPPFMTEVHKSGVFENGEMLGDRRLRNAGLQGQRRDSLLAVTTQALEQRPPRRIGQRFEDDVLGLGHDQSITRWL